VKNSSPNKPAHYRGGWKLPSDTPKSPPSDVGDLLKQIDREADRMAEDGMSRGDLKILYGAMRELRNAFKVFRSYRARRKVTVFGSARTPETHPAYQVAVDFGRRMADLGWFIVTGAASGIMEAGHVGAGRENSMGLNIILPFEQNSNRIIHGDHKLVNMKYFFTRKLVFVKECDAIICFPGGFGTLDEGLEVLTLLQTGKRDMCPVIFMDAPGGTFWKPFDDMIRNALLAEGMISPDDTSLYKLMDNVDDAIEEVLGFFRVYHSMRYVRGKLVLRLYQDVSDELLADINANFAEILSSGTFKRTEALPDERDEPELADMPRLTFHFDRHKLGRLRQLIDAINRGSVEVS
jgi:uncharacterized protein (TIGR00730 family)